MSIHFSEERWKEIEKNYSSWWKGELNRPLVKVTVKKAFEAQREKPKVPILSQENCIDFSYTAQEIVDALDFELSQCEFLGDAFPFVNLWAFGPGSLAGLCGAKMDNSSGKMWYSPMEKKHISDITIKYDHSNKLVKRIKEIYHAGQEKWGNMVLMSMPDLGGFQDVVATFVESEDLIFNLIDEPEEVHRLQQEAYDAFMEAYEDLSSVLMPTNRGYCDWCGLYSKEPTCILQDDFAYMISPKMFEEFAMAEVKKASNRLTNSIYHLDGIGNLRHLECLLEDQNLKAIQWVYGAGQPSARNWMDVYEKIYQAGKGIEVVGDLDDFMFIYERFPNRLYYHLTIDDAEDSTKKNIEFTDCLNDYHIVSLAEKTRVEALLKKIGI